MRKSRKDAGKVIILWRKEPKLTLPVSSIITKVDIDAEIPGATNPFESVTYIDDSRDTCLRYRIYVVSFVNTLFGSAVYYMSKIQSTVFTSST